ncbi:putative ATPase (AAA+ superfamily) [Methanocella conradii HZ254]|uniref:ATPase (AAA+ superfamily) n=1 Tax=Methanocella conradii (strain DSM 24694 / JCM 17849 / CGMCC 1.5162 / HZ254) TaxID=1041930 RepID=H8I4M1_METCZ|nr:ATP-binding protein [Methanocella conradii]AFD00200.1 putative ATPase (AAA+ superfamily) [Methanocella conradii HZ254]
MRKDYIALDEIKRLLESKSRKKVIYINFEDERIPRDEIQDMPDWSRWLRRTYDSYDMQIIVTGSSSKVSSSEIPTELRGRCLEIRVYPLSFKEYLSFKGIQIDVKAAQYSENERAKTARALDDYLYYGGMPEVVLAPEEKKIEILQQYYNTVVSKDISERFRVRNDEALRALLRLLINSTQYSISKMYNTMKSMGYVVGKTSLANYIGYIESSYFLISIPVLSPKIKEQMQCPRKAYLIDNGFISALSTRFSRNMGRLYENAVALELLRRSGHDTETFYRKDRFGKEVDFVVRRGDVVSELIQVCYDVEHPDTRLREVNALARASEELKCDDMKVITSSYEGEEQVKGKIIRFVPLWKYLLE